MNVAEIKNKIDLTYYWDSNIMDYEVYDEGKTIKLLFDFDIDEKSNSISVISLVFKDCNSIKITNILEMDDYRIPIKNRNLAQIGRYLQDIDISDNGSNYIAQINAIELFLEIEFLDIEINEFQTNFYDSNYWILKNWNNTLSFALESDEMNCNLFWHIIGQKLKFQSFKTDYMCDEITIKFVDEYNKEFYVRLMNCIEITIARKSNYETKSYSNLMIGFSKHEGYYYLKITDDNIEISTNFKYVIKTD